MKALVYDRFGGPLSVREVLDPRPDPDGVVVQVEASGICRSDWHGWQGHDPDISLMPHVPGHELAGVVAKVGGDVRRWHAGDRVTVPFCCGCGSCPQCRAGFQNVCDNHFQPGFTAWGSFAQQVAIRHADTNLVRIPKGIDSTTAAGLGCRFITAYRAVVAQGRVVEGEWVVIHGCGGVGLSAIMIAAAFGARVIGIDIDSEKLAFAETIGACRTIHAGEVGDVVGPIIKATEGGAHLSIDALGSRTTCADGVRTLRKRGRHVQVGLMCGEDSQAPVPMDRVIAGELQILGSHGMQAHEYPPMLEMIAERRLDPARLIGHTISLNEAGAALEAMGDFRGVGITVIDRF